jgi:hypothetical protein
MLRQEARMSRVVATVGIALMILGTTGCGADASAPPLAAPTAPTPAPTQAPRQQSGFVGTYAADVTLSGVVYETTVTGPRPLGGATIYCDACGEWGHTWASTDANGFYTFTGMWLPFNPVPLHVEKEGYEDPPDLPALKGSHAPKGPGWREVTISGHTRFDMHLIRHQ